MEDREIIALYWQRSESAIEASRQKYGPYCHTIAHNILASVQDAEECVSDTWLHAWNAMPPQKPSRLGAFLSKLTRNLALDRFRERTAQRRGGSQADLALEELKECVASPAGTEAEFDRRELERDLSRFLRTLPRRDAGIFLRRYFFADATGRIAGEFGLKESNVLLILSRTRKKLRTFLQKEGYTL